MHRSIALFCVLLLGACGGGGGTGDSGPTFVSFTTFQEAARVLGQADFTSNAANRGGAVAANTLASPAGPCLVGGRLFIADLGNPRVLGFNAMPATGGAAADFVLGQADFAAGSANQGGAVGPGTLSQPWAVAAAGGRLFVSDFGNSRVLIYNSVPTSTGAVANVALGVPDLMSVGGSAGQAGLSAPVGIHAVGTKLIVCDANNHRVMIWNTIPATSGTSADLVLGQADFLPGSNQPNRGGVSPAANTLNTPFGCWSDGTRLVVADGFNHRVLIWDTFPTTNGQAADHVLGQAAFNTAVAATTQLGMRVPTDVSSDGTKLVVGDCENNRILIYDAFPVATNTAPTTVLGQGVFTLGAGNDDNQDGMTDGVGTGLCTAKTMNVTAGYAYVKLIGSQLLSGDRRNNRVLMYQAN